MLLLVVFFDEEINISFILSFYYGSGAFVISLVVVAVLSLLVLLLPGEGVRSVWGLS